MIPPDIFTSLPSFKDFKQPSNIKERNFRRKRSTYSINNALKFKPIFDHVIKTRKDTLIPYEGNNPPGFHIKVSDALKWLLDNWDKEDYAHLRDESYKPNIYAQLRGEVKLRATIEGVLIKFNTSVIIPHFIPIDVQKNSEWKDQLLAFLEDPERKLLKLDGLYLSDEDITYVKDTLSNVEGIIFDVTINELTVGKNLT